MKRICTYIATILIISCSLSSSISAQSSGGANKRLIKPTALLPVDSTRLECIFSYTAYDPVLDERKEDVKILQIGRAFSKYFDYGAFQLDSLIAADYPDGLAQSEYRKYSIAHLPSWDAVIKNFNGESIKVYDRLPFSDHYVYDDGLNLMKWTLGNETREICGHLCRKATTSFRGRNWTAWYTTEIPIDNGPWKFGGLPGLILMAESDDHQQRFEAIAIRKAARQIGVKDFTYRKTTREKFNKEFEESRTKPSQFHKGNTLVPKDEDGSSIISQYRRHFFSPIELE